jgi:hypothetical protein
MTLISRILGIWSLFPAFVLETLLEIAFLFSYSCGRGAADLHHSSHFETLDVSSILAQAARLMYSP